MFNFTKVGWTFLVLIQLSFGSKSGLYDVITEELFQNKPIYINNIGIDQYIFSIFSYSNLNSLVFLSKV